MGFGPSRSVVSTPLSPDRLDTHAVFRQPNGGMAVLCHCVVVSDHGVADAVARGAVSLTEVQAHCGAGTRCGGCVGAIEAALDRCRAALETAAA